MKKLCVFSAIVSVLFVSMSLCHALPGKVTEISSIEELLKFSQDSQSNDFDGEIIKLTCDIDLYGAYFNSIPVFAGTFDGGGHTISNYYIISSATHFTNGGTASGFFNLITLAGTVKNLTTAGNVYGEKANENENSYTGGIAGINFGKILSCHNKGEITAGYGNQSYTAGIVGWNAKKAVVTDCTNTGEIYGADTKDYCLAGEIAGINSGELLSCNNNGKITGGAGAGCVTGGISGENQGIIHSCFNGNEVTGNFGTLGSDTGGITGCNYGTLRDCVNNAYVFPGQSAVKSTTGEVVGFNDDSGIIVNCKPERR